MKNIPDVKIGIVAVSRDCFPESLSVSRRAALVKAYYPNLTGAQIRNILLNSVTSRKGVEVEKGIIVDGKQAQDLFLFEDLCLSGGILNAYRAIMAADKFGK